MTKQLEHTPASGAVLGVIMAFADYERQIAELTTRLAALEKAAEPKPPAPASPPLLEIDDAYRARDRHVGVASDRIQGILDDPNTRPYAIVMVRCELQAAFAAGVEFARRERNPQTYDDEKILTEPLDGCHCCNHTFEERRAYRLGYYAGSIGQEPDTCPYLDHAPFADSWTEGHRVGYAVWEQLNPNPDESVDEPCRNRLKEAIPGIDGVYFWCPECHGRLTFGDGKTVVDYETELRKRLGGQVKCEDCGEALEIPMDVQFERVEDPE